jgi:hypothetical protein
MELGCATLVGISAISCGGTRNYDLNERDTRPAEPPPRDSSWKDKLGELIMPLFDKDDTEYSSGFNETVFRSLEMGLPQNEVARRLGNPFLTRTFADGNTCWYYSRHGRKWKSYFVRVLEFDRDWRLMRRYAAFYVD